MKKIITLILLITAVFLCSCSDSKRDLDGISQLRFDVLICECDDYSVFAYKEIREEPFLEDGSAGETKKVLIFKIQFKNVTALKSSPTLSFSQNNISYRKELEYKPLSNYVSCIFDVTEFPNSFLEVNITINGENHSLRLNSTLNKNTLGYKKIVQKVKKSTDTDILAFFNENKQYEMKIRLLPSEGFNYYYLGLIGKNQSLDLLLDGVSGEIIAKKK